MTDKFTNNKDKRIRKRHKRNFKQQITDEEFKENGKLPENRDSNSEKSFDDVILKGVTNDPKTLNDINDLCSVLENCSHKGTQYCLNASTNSTFGEYSKNIVTLFKHISEDSLTDTDGEITNIIDATRNYPGIAIKSSRLSSGTTYNAEDIINEILLKIENVEKDIIECDNRQKDIEDEVLSGEINDSVFNPFLKECDTTLVSSIETDLANTLTDLIRKCTEVAKKKFKPPSNQEVEEQCVDLQNSRSANLNQPDVNLTQNENNETAVENITRPLNSAPPSYSFSCSLPPPSSLTFANGNSLERFIFNRPPPSYVESELRCWNYRPSHMSRMYK